MYSLLVIFMLSLPPAVHSAEPFDRETSCARLAANIGKSTALLKNEKLTYDNSFVRFVVATMDHTIKLHNLYCTKWNEPIPPYKIPIRFTL